MKLQTKFNRATITVTIIVLLIASVAYYFFIRYILISQLDQSLIVEEVEVYHHVQVNGKLPAESHFGDQRIVFEEVTIPPRRHFSSKMVRNPANNESETARLIIFPVHAEGKIYTCTVTKSQTKTEHLLFVILAITVGVIFLIVSVLFVLNRFLMKKLWMPFHSTLNAMKEFNLSDPSPIKLQSSAIDEFNALNAAWTQMTHKINDDYTSLKNFADNASHEMQTPLAVINSKLDLLIQDQQITEKSLHHVQAMYDAIDRLTKLNQSLLLITKIENNQFKEKTSIDLSTVLRERLSNLEELIHARHLTVNTDLAQSIVAMHPMLADILVSNLLVNAIRHNNSNGVINLSSRKGFMSISNSGEAVGLDTNTVFNRNLVK